MSPRSLSNRELHSQLTRLVRRERSICLEVLDHLNEIEHRKLHLELGFRSMFDYCTRGLGYSESAAGRRVQVARCVGRFPEVRSQIAAGEVNLSTVGQIASILTRANKESILRAIAGRSQRDVEAIASRFRPPIAIRDRVRPVRVVVAAAAQGAGAPAHSRDGSASGERGRPNVSRVTSGSGEDAATELLELNHSRSESAKIPNSARTVQKMFIQFTASPDIMTKLEKMRTLLSTKIPQGASFEDVFDVAMDLYIEKHDPEAKQARRSERAKKKNQRAEPAAHDVRSKRRNEERETIQKSGRRKPSKQAPACGKPSRYVPPATRDAVYARDGGRCAYESATGKRCGSRHNLHVDHIVPHARGGSNALSNLRLLCARHNRLEAERLLGPAVKRFTRRE